MTRNRDFPFTVVLDPVEGIFGLDFDDGAHFNFPAEYLRVESPSAEVQGHGPGERRTIAGKHAVVALTETLYQDLGLVTSQVSCSVLCPYFVPTGIFKSERNRPAALSGAGELTASQRIAREMGQKAVTSGKVSAAEVALATFEAVGANQFYVYSHPKALGNVETRMRAIIEGRNPPDPFAARPDVGARLRAQLSAR